MGRYATWPSDSHCTTNIVSIPCTKVFYLFWKQHCCMYMIYGCILCLTSVFNRPILHFLFKVVKWPVHDCNNPQCINVAPLKKRWSRCAQKIQHGERIFRLAAQKIIDFCCHLKLQTFVIPRTWVIPTWTHATLYGHNGMTWITVNILLKINFTIWLVISKLDKINN